MADWDRASMLSRVDLRSIRRYLLVDGWVQLQPKPGVDVPFEMWRSGEKGSDSPRVMLPLDPSAPDLSWRVSDTVRVLAEMKGYTVPDLVRAIATIGYDVVRSSVPNERVSNESIRLSTATDFVAGMRSLLAATATTEIRPIPFFGRLSRESIQFADACRFAHTYQGSFGFVIESPLPDEPVAPLLKENPPLPFERRVIQRLATGLSHIVSAADTGDLKYITEATRSGLGANGCEQLAEIVEKVSPEGLKFNIELSPAWSVARDGSATIFNLNSSHAEVCRAAAKELRNSEVQRVVRVRGRVIRLQNQTDPTDLRSRTGEHEVVVLWSSMDFGDISVRVNLTPSDYLAAINAHGAGRPISIDGNLRKQRRSWLLTEAHSFRVSGADQLDLNSDGSIDDLSR